MPRLNIYLPEDVYELANRWRGSSNLSEICARAIKDEFSAAEDDRTSLQVFQHIRPRTDLESELASELDLKEVVIADTPEDPTRLRQVIGTAAARYLDQNVADGSLIAVAGGRQIWSTVQQLSSRRVQTTITSLGMHQADPQLLHAHPNTLTTLLWLLYSPRSRAHVIGPSPLPAFWHNNLPARSYPSYFVVSSCAPFVKGSSFAQLIGRELTTKLTTKKSWATTPTCFLITAEKKSN